MPRRDPTPRDPRPNHRTQAQGKHQPREEPGHQKEPKAQERPSAHKGHRDGVTIATMINFPQFCKFQKGAPRERAQFCNSEKMENRTALQSCISGKGHPRKRAQFCNSVKLEIANEQIS